MRKVTLGRTGLEATVMGLGCGGHSRLGLSTGKTRDDAIRIARRALDLGINFFDTAEGYQTEAILGEALAAVPRESVIISTKIACVEGESPLEPGRLIERFEACLKRLNTAYADILHLHGVAPRQYPHAARSLVPALEKLKAAGKIRFMGITEGFESDPRHEMFRLALTDSCWDVIMVGFNMLNQSARETVFPKAAAHGSGVLCMFAVRRAFSRPERLAEILRDLRDRRLIDPESLDWRDPFGSLLKDSGAENLQDAAYRFCRDEPGIHVVLSGTGDTAHLEANLASLRRPPLGAPALERLRAAFAGVNDVSGG